MSLVEKTENRTQQLNELVQNNFHRFVACKVRWNVQYADVDVIYSQDMIDDIYEQLLLGGDKSLATVASLSGIYQGSYL